MGHYRCHHDSYYSYRRYGRRGIIGSGASGATAAKVLTEAGIHVVVLERGPWMKQKDFGGDELANVNRCYLWSDRTLNPRLEPTW